MTELPGIRPAELETLLASADLFDSLTGEEIGILTSYCALYQLSDNELLYSAGSEGNELYVLESGGITITQSRESGQEETVARLIGGESFGELDLISNDPREESARANGATRVLIFPRRGEDFSAILSARPVLGARLLRKLMGAVAARLRQANDLYRRNSLWVQELQRQVYTDPLTGLLNRTYLEENLVKFLQGESCSLLMFKPDNFKQINDSFGHEAGDKAIRTIGGVLQELKGDSEVLVRFMGNEYALIIPGSDEAEAVERAEFLQRQLIALKYEQSDSKNVIVVTVSVGIALYPLHGENPLALIEGAHTAAMRGRTVGGSKILFPEEEKQ